MPEQRAPGDRMEDLRGLGLHPRREARRKHDRQRRVAHRVLLQGGGPGFEPGIADPKSAALPLGHAQKDTAQRIRATQLRPPPPPRRQLAPLDQLSDASTALAAQLRVPLATELRLARLPALPTELRVAARAELRLARLAALASKLRVALGSKLSLTRLAPTSADLAIERGSVLARGRGAAALTGLTDGELSPRIHYSNVGG